MEATFKINNADSWRNYGARIDDGFVDNLLNMLEMKAVPTNAIRTEHGELELEMKPRFASREVLLVITFRGRGSTLKERQQSYRQWKYDFEQLLYTNPNITIQIPDRTDEIFRLRYLGKSSTYHENLSGTFGKVQIRFKESNPANRGKTDLRDKL